VGKEEEEEVRETRGGRKRSLARSLSRNKTKGEKLQDLDPHQRQVLGGGLLDRGSQVGVEVDDVLEVKAELRRVLVEGVTVVEVEEGKEREMGVGWDGGVGWGGGGGELS